MKIAQSRRVAASLKKPRALQIGDTISVVSPASPPTNPKVLLQIREQLENLGFKVRLGKYSGERKGYLAGSDRERLSDLNHAFSHRSVRAILCVRGGYGVSRILPAVRFKLLRDDPKIVVGCSDITALLQAGLIEAGVTMFHGPMAQGLVQPDCPNFTWQSLLQNLFKREAAIGSITTGYAGAAAVEGLRRGVVTAPLVGGNLSILLSLLGTRYFPSLAGKIVCLEDIGEKPFRLDRMLTQLIAVGAFDSVAGFALGDFKDCEYPQAIQTEPLQTVRDVIIERLVPLKKPIVFGLPFGHNPHNATLPLGVCATLNGTAGDLVIEEFGVR
jgi:muramoyltetrapeptide carboxypeptidase